MDRWMETVVAARGREQDRAREVAALRDLTPVDSELSLVDEGCSRSPPEPGSDRARAQRSVHEVFEAQQRERLRMLAEARPEAAREVARAREAW